MSRAFEIVDEDRAPDADLVTETAGVGELFVEARMRANQLSWMRFSGVDENPVGVRTPGRDFAQQRTLRTAVRSGEGAELDHEVAFDPEIRQLHAAPAVEDGQHRVRGSISGMKTIEETSELSLIAAGSDVFVEAVVVVRVHLASVSAPT